jgi:hypothetical protein
MVEKYCNEDLEDCEFYGDGEIKTAVYYIENF